MAKEQSQEVWQVSEPFAVFTGPTPELYGAERMVLADDPILRTHRSHFAPVAKRVAQKDRYVTAAPVVVPILVEEASRG